MTETIHVNIGGLKRLQSRPPIGEYLRDIWRTRNFTLLNARTGANKNGRDTFLGRIWVLLDPLLQTAFYGFIFGVVLQVSKGMDNFPGFLAIGVVFFRITTRGLATGSNLVRRSRALMSSFNFPRGAVVIGETLKHAIDGIVPALVAVGLALLWQLDKPVSWTVVLVVPIYVLMQFFSLGCSFVVARACAFLPDLRSLVNLVVRGLFFLSGIFFSIDRFVNHPTLELLMKLNPVHQFLSAARVSVLDGTVPSAFTWAYITCWSLGLTLIGFVYFWAAEGRYATLK
ncbi:ABC transporter permease [Corynebacterium pilbarense]